MEEEKGMDREGKEERRNSDKLNKEGNGEDIEGGDRLEERET